MHPLLLRSSVKLVGSRRPVGKVGEAHGVFPGLSIRDRAGAVRRGSAQPTVHKFTASARHGVRRPVPSLSSIGRGKPRSVCASRVPDADVADYTVEDQTKTEDEIKKAEQYQALKKVFLRLLDDPRVEQKIVSLVSRQLRQIRAG